MEYQKSSNSTSTSTCRGAPNGAPLKKPLSLRDFSESRFSILSLMQNLENPRGGEEMERNLLKQELDEIKRAINAGEYQYARDILMEIASIVVMPELLSMSLSLFRLVFLGLQMEPL